MTKNSGIYKIVHGASSRCYVGSTVDISRRWRKHRCLLAKGTHHSVRLQRAWNKYGADAFDFICVEIVAPGDLVRREQFWMDMLDTYTNGFNCRPVAQSQLGFKMSDESRAKISCAQKGKKLSEKHRLALARGNIGHSRPLSKEARAKISQKNKGRKHTDAARANMSRGQQNRAPFSEEQRRNIAASLKGRKFSEQTLKNMSAAKKGRKHSVETKRKMSAAHQIRLALRSARENILSREKSFENAPPVISTDG